MTSTLYKNGFIHSPADPFAEAILVDNGMIAWLGANDSAAAFAKNADRVVDLDGALVTPGFVDSHVHLLETALARRAVAVSPDSGGHSTGQVLDLLAGPARQWSGALGVITAFGYDDSRWTGPALCQQDLDEAFAGVELYVPRADLHSGLISSALQHRLGVQTSDGIVAGPAHQHVRTAIRTFTPAQREVLYREVLGHAASRGVVAVHENSAPGIDTREGLAQLLALTAAADSGLPAVVGYLGELIDSADQALEIAAQIPGLRGFAGDLSVDGSFGSRSAALRASYIDIDPGALATRGTLHLSQEQIAGHVAAVTRAGLTAGFHVIGDRALDTVLAAFDQVATDPDLARAMRRLGHRLEHVELVDQPAIDALVRHGISVSVQPAFDAFWGGPGGMYETRLGAQRAGATTPVRSLLAAGIPTGLGSDAPVTPIDPWGAVTAALFHHNRDQRVSARAAFRAHTRGAWRIGGATTPGAGEIRIGSPADLAIWRCDELGVQAENSGRSSWSTDFRGGSPLLPILGPDSGPVTCLATLRAGVEIFAEM